MTAKQIKVLVDTSICAMLRHTLIAHISGKEGSFNNMVHRIHQPVEKQVKFIYSQKKPQNYEKKRLSIFLTLLVQKSLGDFYLAFSE